MAAVLVGTLVVERSQKAAEHTVGVRCVDLDAIERDARVLLERERDLVDEVLGNGANVRAVLDDDVQRHVHAGVGGGDRHAAAQAAGGQDLGDPVGSGRCGHADDAVALERGVADHVGQDIVGNMEVAGNGIVHGVPFWLAYAGSKLLLAV